tara:strand:+ start:253 stop:1359 length:1107 start_codon:yes stop_codon:yes gene_type:complete
MPDQISSIGATGDHTTIADWEAATDIALTSGEVTYGLCQDQNFTAGATIAGATGQNSTTYRVLMADDGTFGEAGSDQGFKAHVSGSDPLRADNTKGACVTVDGGTTALSIDESYARIQRMQCINTTTAYSPLMTIINGNTDPLITQCIVYQQADFYGSDYCIEAFGGHISNCLCYVGENITVTGTHGGIRTWYGTQRLYFNTVLNPTSDTDVKNGISNANISGAQIYKCNLVMEFNTKDFAEAANPTYTWDYNGCSDTSLTDPTTGDDPHPVENIAYNTSTGGSNLGITATGASGNLDAKLKSGSACESQGTDLSSETSSWLDSALKLDVDIIDTARHATTPTIGCWEIAAAGGGITAGSLGLLGVGI